MRPHAVFNQRARGLVLSLIVVASIVTLGGAASAGYKPGPAVVKPGGVDAFARLGDCPAATEGATCHFVSAVVSGKTLQIELTTTDGESFTSDVLCNVHHAKIRIARRPVSVGYDDVVRAGDCEFLHGETPSNVTVDLLWSSVGPMTAGSNPCAVDATINGATMPTLFCSLLVS